MLLVGLVLSVSGGSASVFDWRISRVAASYEGALCNCVAETQPFANEDILTAARSDFFRLSFACKEQASEILVAIVTKSVLDELVLHESFNQSLQIFRDSIKATAKAWAEGHSGTIEWRVDLTGRYGWIAVPYRALIGQLGSWEISFKVVVEQSSQNPLPKCIAGALATLGIATIVFASFSLWRTSHSRKILGANQTRPGSQGPRICD